MADIKQLLKVGGINTERVATDLFGNAVEDFVAGPLNDVLKSSFGSSESTTVNRNDGSWHATSYAASLADSQFRPKLKFLFRVEFLFKPGILEMFGQGSAPWAKNFAFLIRTIDRPKVDFEYEETNMYNFRTKVLKSIKHRSLTLSMLDDVGNNSQEFFRFMMMLHSPITRRSIGATSDIASTLAQYSTGSGMQFSKSPVATVDFAHRAVIDTDVGNAIQAIKITQMFMQPGGKNDLQTGAKEISFFFINPRIEAFDLEDVAHDSNDPSVLSMQFDYDFLVMSDIQTLQPIDPSKAMPAAGGAPGEASPVNRTPNAQSPEGANNPYLKTLSALGGRAATKLTNEKLGKYIRQVPGLGSVADTIGGLVGRGVSGSIGSAGSAIGTGQAFAAPTRDIIRDSGTVGSDKPNAVVGTPKGGG